MVKRGIREFDWDEGNIDKSNGKHGITPNEAEEIFLDENLHVEKDVKHGQTEDRFIAIGRITEGKNLFVVFTLRKEKIRIISARLADSKERKIYGKKT